MIVISDKIELNSRKDLILIHLYIKSKEYKVDISDGIRELIYYIYENKGISSIDDLNKVTENCIKTSSLKKKGTIKNTISKCVGMGIIINDGKYKKSISNNWLPSTFHEEIGLEYKIKNKID